MKTINQFILRNKQIFVTGVVIGIIFLLIILFSSARKVRGPELAPTQAIPDSTEKNIDYETDQYDPKGLWNAPVPSQYFETKEEDTVPEEPAEKPTEILEITFDEKGFSPASSYGILYQKVRWTNKTAKSIYIKQMKDFFPELKEPVEIYPESSLEIELNKLGVWGYQETSTEKMGSIFILKEKVE